jgi:multiple sugar transport system ATP-binding protein
VRIALPQRRAECLKGESGEVLVGIRPEHLEPAGTAAGAAGVAEGGDSRVQGVVEVVEPLGPEQYVVVDVGGETLTARTGRDSSIKVADKIVFAVDGSLVHLFDPASGLALR